jgi:hypothetical protein
MIIFKKFLREKLVQLTFQFKIFFLILKYCLYILLG